MDALLSFAHPALAAAGERALLDKVQGSGFRVQGSGFRVQGAGCRVQGFARALWSLDGSGGVVSPVRGSAVNGGGGASLFGAPPHPRFIHRRDSRPLTLLCAQQGAEGARLRARHLA